MGLTSMSLGRRHMLQLAWDLSRLAQDFGRDPNEVLKNQPLLIIVNEASVTSVEMDFLEAGYYGFDPAKVFFMVQKSFHGLNLGQGGWFYDNSSPRRLHNHGQMLIADHHGRPGLSQRKRRQRAPALAHLPRYAGGIRRTRYPSTSRTWTTSASPWT